MTVPTQERTTTPKQSSRRQPKIRDEETQPLRVIFYVPPQAVADFALVARFRNKKKQWLLNMERTVTSLSSQVEDLEREAADLRRENGWLKEIVMLKARRAIGGGPVNLPGSLGDRNEAHQPDTGKGKKRQQ